MKPKRSGNRSRSGGTLSLFTFVSHQRGGLGFGGRRGCMEGGRPAAASSCTPSGDPYRCGGGQRAGRPPTTRARAGRRANGIGRGLARRGATDAGARRPSGIRRAWSSWSASAHQPRHRLRLGAASGNLALPALHAVAERRRRRRPCLARPTPTGRRSPGLHEACCVCIRTAAGELPARREATCAPNLPIRHFGHARVQCPEQ